MPAFRQLSRLHKLDTADARWLRSKLAEAFPEGLPSSPVGVLAKLTDTLEQTPSDDQWAWLRAWLLQEMQRGLRRYADAVYAGRIAYRLRPWDPRSVYGLALTYFELSYGRADDPPVAPALGGLPLNYRAKCDPAAVERALAELDLTEEQAAIQALQLFQAALALSLPRSDRRRVRRAIERLTQHWPSLAPTRPRSRQRQRALRPAVAALRSTLGDYGAKLKLMMTSAGGRVTQVVQLRPSRRWVYGSLAIALTVGALGFGLLSATGDSSVPPHQNAMAVDEDLTTELLVLDHEGMPLSGMLEVYRDSPLTVVVILVNRGQQLRRYELGVRIDEEEWPLGLAEVAPGARWEGGFQVTLSESPRTGLQIVARDAGMLTIARSWQLALAVRDATGAVRATSEPSATPEPTATPEAEVPAAPSPRPFPVNAATFSAEPRPSSPPVAPRTTGVASAPTMTATPVRTATPTSTSSVGALPTLPATLPPGTVPSPSPTQLVLPTSSAGVTRTATPSTPPQTTATPVLAPSQPATTPVPATTVATAVATPTRPSPSSATPPSLVATPTVVVNGIGPSQQER